MQVDIELEKQINKAQDQKKLMELALSKSGGERALAQHEKADALLLRRLAGHGDKYVRYFVAKNTNADITTLKELARDREVIVREAARLNLIFKQQDSLRLK